jgi:hypothetical protein
MEEVDAAGSGAPVALATGIRGLLGAAGSGGPGLGAVALAAGTDPAAGNDGLGGLVDHHRPAAQALCQQFGDVDLERGVVWEDVGQVADDPGVTLITVLNAEPASTKHASPSH